MKKYNFLLFFSMLFFCCSESICQQTSSLVIFTENGERFYLILNGIRQNDNPETNIQVDGLIANYYNTKIIFEDGTLGEVNKGALNVVDPNGIHGQVTYVVRHAKKGAYKIRFQSFVATPPPPPSNTTIVMYNTVPKPPISASVSITETVTTITSAPGTTEHFGASVSVGGVNIGVNANVGGTSTTTSSTTVTTTETYTTGSTTTTSPIVTETVTVGCSMATCMSPIDFQNALSSIASNNFEDSKLIVAKQIIESNCVTSKQVRKIMLLFDFEDSKLDFAKFAHSRTADPQNYYVINDAFDFEQSITELNNFIR